MTVDAGPVEPLKPSEIVNLFTGAGLGCSSCGDNCREFNKQVTGTEVPTFTGIPSGQVLVATGLDWTGGGDGVASDEGDGGRTGEQLLEPLETRVAGGDLGQGVLDDRVGRVATQRLRRPDPL